MKILQQSRGGGNEKFCRNAGVVGVLCVRRACAAARFQGYAARYRQPATGAYSFRTERAGAGGQGTLLIDCGRGCSQRLWQGSVKVSSSTVCSLRTCISDHIVGIPDLWLTGWLVAVRPAPHARSGCGAAAPSTLMEHLEKAYLWDIDTPRPQTRNCA